MNLFDGFDLEEKFSFEAFMEEYFGMLGVQAEVFDGYFIDIGIPEDYVRAQNELKEHVWEKHVITSYSIHYTKLYDLD